MVVWRGGVAWWCGVVVVMGVVEREGEGGRKGEWRVEARVFLPFLYHALVLKLNSFNKNKQTPQTTKPTRQKFHIMLLYIVEKACCA